MLKGGVDEIRDRFNGRFLRPAEAVPALVLEIIQTFYEERGRWSRIEEEAGIFVATEHAFALSKVGSKPAIMVQRGPVKFDNVAGMNSMQKHSFKDGSEIYMDTVSTSISINCMDAHPKVADDLGLDMFELFGYLRHQHSKRGFFRSGPVSISELRKLKENAVRPQDWITMVQFAVSMQLSWKVEKEASVLKSIVMDIS